jgi:hypothetical protein
MEDPFFKKKVDTSDRVITVTNSFDRGAISIPCKLT